MGFRVRRDDAPGGRDVRDRFAGWGLAPRAWGNPPGDSYGWHDHPYYKVLYCVRGTITFHGRGATDVELRAGDRLDIDPHTEHAATVGPDGVECVEASTDRPPGGAA